MNPNTGPSLWRSVHQRVHQARNGVPTSSSSAAARPARPSRRSSPSAGHQVELFEREVPALPHRRVAHPADVLTCSSGWACSPRCRAATSSRSTASSSSTEHGKLSEPFYFIDHKPHESSQTWQVRRSEFDQLMLDNAREHGVEVHEGVRVLEVLFEGERAVGVRVQAGGRHASARCGRRWSSTPAARARCSSTGSACASGTRC